MSHELQTQLIIVQQHLPLTIDRGDNLTERQVKGLSTAEEESIRMQRIFKELRLVLAGQRNAAFFADTSAKRR